MIGQEEGGAAADEGGVVGELNTSAGGTSTANSTSPGTNSRGGEGSMAATTNNTFVDRIDPFAKRSLKKKQKKSQGSSRYHQANEADLAPLPLFKGGWRVSYLKRGQLRMLIELFKTEVLWRIRKFEVGRLWSSVDTARGSWFLAEILLEN